MNTGSSGLSTPQRGVKGRLGVGKVDSGPPSVLPPLPSRDQGVAGKSLNFTVELPGEPCLKHLPGCSLQAWRAQLLGPELGVHSLLAQSLTCTAYWLRIMKLRGRSLWPPGRRTA